MNTVSMNNLWNYLQGLSLTANNRKWLADRLIENSTDCAMSDTEIREGLNHAFTQLNELKAGKRKSRSVEELLYEL
ncbi:MAG: surface protein [Prevotella sp.]|nr:surface protein [Prevotella sp.]